MSDNRLLMSSDKEVLKFLRRLGMDTKKVTQVKITFTAAEPVTVEAHYNLKSKKKSVFRTAFFKLGLVPVRRKIMPTEEQVRRLKQIFGAPNKKYNAKKETGES